MTIPPDKGNTKDMNEHKTFDSVEVVAETQPLQGEAMGLQTQ